MTMRNVKCKEHLWEGWGSCPLCAQEVSADTHKTCEKHNWCYAGGGCPLCKEEKTCSHGVKIKDDCKECDAIFTSAERDPHGTDPHSPGAKLDAGKLKAALVMGDFANALTEVIRVGTFGANKYTDHGWITVPDGINRYTDAMQRHYLKEITEGPLDDDSGITHAGHLAWNALARLELMLREKKNG